MINEVPLGSERFEGSHNKMMQGGKPKVSVPLFVIFTGTCRYIHMFKYSCLSFLVVHTKIEGGKEHLGAFFLSVFSPPKYGCLSET